MMKRKGLAYIAALWAVFYCLSASAQYVPNHAVPLGTGAGSTGYNSVGPCLTGQSPVWASGVSADATCVDVASPRLSNKASGYAAVDADCGSSIGLSGGFTTLTVNAATGYRANCSFWVTDQDTTSGKTLAINGFNPSTQIIYPGQTVRIYAQNNVWYVDQPNPRWRLQNSTSFYIGCVTSTGATCQDTNDCISATTSCTFQGVMNLFRQKVDFNKQSVIAQIIDGTYDVTTPITINYQPLGSQQFSISGNCNTPGNVIVRGAANNISIFFLDDGGATVTFSCLDIRSNGIATGVTGITAQQLSVADLDRLRCSNITVCYAMLHAADMNVIGSMTYFGAITQPYQAFGSGSNLHLGAGMTHTITAGATCTIFVNAGFGAQVLDDGSPIIVSGSFNAGCQQFNWGENTNVNLTAGTLSVMPGSVAGVDNRSIINTGTSYQIPYYVASSQTPKTVSGVSISGIVKGNGGSGAPSAAVAGTDYQAAITQTGALKGTGGGGVGQAATTDLSDVTQLGSWTPSDASGAALTFTVTDAVYTKIGKLCIVSGSIQWPATGSAAAVSVGGLPCTARTGTSAYVGGGTPSLISAAGVAALPSIGVVNNATTFTMFNGGGGQISNTNMSSGVIRFTIHYLTN